MVIVVAMLATAFGPAASAQEPDAGPGAQLASHLRSWALVIAERGYAPELAARIPLTRRDVREVLDLPTVLQQELVAVLDAAAVADPTVDELEEQVDGAGDSGVGSYDLTVTPIEGTDDLSVDLGFTVVRTTSVPVTYQEVEFLDHDGQVIADLAAHGDDEVLIEDTVIELHGGADDGSVPVTITASFAASFTFSDQRDGPVASGGLTLDELGTASVVASGSQPDLALSGRVGLTEVDAAGALSFDRRWQLSAVDPDAVGGLDLADWETSLGETVLPIETVPGEDPAVDLQLALAAPQTPAEADGTVSWSVVDPTEPGAAAMPTVELGPQLASFRNLSASDVLSGLTKLGALVATAESRGDVVVPFTDASVGNIVDLRTKVLGAVQQQAAALVLCGRTDTSPPLGAELSGTTWYCQAYTQDEARPGSVEWSVTAGDATIEVPDADGTVGPEPGANVVVSGVDELPAVSVRWTDDASGTELVANRRFETLGELAASLERDLAAAGSTASVTVGDLDPETGTVPLSVEATVGSTTVPAAYLIGNDLGAAALQGVEPVPGVVDVTVGPATMAADLDISLAERSFDPTARPDRFRLVPGDQPLLTVDEVTSAVPDTVAAEGRVGYLPVDVTATGFDTTTADGDQPAMEVSVVPPSGTEDISLAEALRDPVGSLQASHAVTMADGTVSLAATSVDGEELLPADPAPTATVTWADVTPGSAPAIDPDEAWDSTVRPYDVVPTVTGMATTADPDGIELVDAGASFLTAFGPGLEAGDELVGQLFNRATQASCSRFVVVSDTTLRCSTTVEEDGETGLEGGSARIDPVTGAPTESVDEELPDADEVVAEIANDWQVGDRYEVNGDVTALGGIVVEGWIDAALRLAAVDDAGLTENLPLLDLAPIDLLPQLADVPELLQALLPRVAPNGVDGVEPLADLTQLEQAIEAADGADVDVRFAVQSLTPATGAAPVRHLVGTLSATRSGTIGGAEAPTVHAAVPATEDGAPALEFGTDVAGDGDVGPEVTWSSTVDIALGVPIDPGVAPTALLVVGGTGVSELTATVDTETIDLTGRLGSLAVELGAGAVRQGTVPATTGTNTGGPVVDAVSVGSVPGEDEAPTSTTTFRTATDVSDASEGDVIVTTADAWCSIAALVAVEGGTDISCAAPLTDGATFAADDVVAIHQSRTATTDEAVPEDIAPGHTITHRPSGATCVISSVEEHSITCDEPLQGAGSGAAPAWSAGDGWSVGVSRNDTLRVPGAAFDTYGLVEGVDTVRELSTDDGAVVATCTITAITADALTCDGGLGDGESWAPGDRWEIGGAGRVGVSVAYSLGRDAAAPLDVAEEDAGTSYFDLLSGGLEGQPGAEATCGDATGLACLRLAIGASAEQEAPAEPAAEEDPPGGGGSLLGFIDAVVDPDGTTTVSVSPGARSTVAGEAIDLGLLATVLPFVAPVLDDALDGDTAPSSGEDPEPAGRLPLVGDDLAVGAPISEAVDALGMALLELEVGDVAGLAAAVEALLTSAMLPEGVATSDVTVSCDGGDCTGVDDPSEVEVGFVVSENLVEGTTPQVGCREGSCGAATGSASFSFGLPGVQIEAAQPDGALTARRAWSLPIVIGVDKATGPYLDVSAAEDLVLGGTAGIAPADTATDLSPCENSPGNMASSVDLFGLDAGPGTDAADYDIPDDDVVTGRRCFDGSIGMLTATFWDGTEASGPFSQAADVPHEHEANDTGDVNQSRVDVKTSVDLVGEGDRLSVIDLLERDDAFGRSVDAFGDVDLYVVTGSTTEAGGLVPTVHSSVHWNFATDDAPDGTNADGSPSIVGVPDELRYLDVVINLRSFFDDLVGPWAADAAEYLAYLRPVADFLLTPIPGLKELAEAIGNPPPSLFSMIQEATGQDLTLVYSLLQFFLFADNLSSGLAEDESGNPDDGYTGLNGPNPEANCAAGADEETADPFKSPCGLSTKGGFTIDPDKVHEAGPCGEAVVKGKQTKVSKDCKKTTRSRNVSVSSLGKSTNRENIKQLRRCPASGCTGNETARTIGKQAGFDLGTPGLAFPFLTYPEEMYGMLLGESDAELIRIDLGTLTVDFGVEFEWGPFMAGPVPIEIGVGGGIQLGIRAMLGIDTLGLRTTGDLADGFFINDRDPLQYDLQGDTRDVAELTMTFTISVSAAISLKVVKAGVKGTLQFILGADLNDPNGDGRVRPSELASFGDNPQCALVFRGDLRVILSVFVALDFKIWQKEWSYDLFRRTWNLFEIKCETPSPQLARTSGSDVVLHVGAEAEGKRGIEEDETDETFNVRVIDPPNAGSRTVTVEAFGLVQEYELGAGGKVVADMGSGEDHLVLAAGASTDGSPVPFDLPSKVTLGDGNDSFEGGDGPDQVAGGAGNDTIVGGEGADVLDGDAGRDAIDGSRGPDTLRGGADDDRLSGAQDADVIDGGAGDDRIQGGPGMSASQSEKVVALQRSAGNLPPAPAEGDDPLVSSLADGDDVLIGGLGADDVSGHFGDDRIIGSTASTGELRTADLDALCAAAVELGISGPVGFEIDLRDAGDTLDGGPGHDVLAGGEGDDDITGSRGDDDMCGGSGDDHLRGEGQEVPGTGGADTLRGGVGDDIVEGGDGGDDLDGGPDADLVDGADGADTVSGGPGPDLVVGGAGADTLDGDGRPGQPASASAGTLAVCQVAVTIRAGLVELGAAIPEGATVRVGGYGYVVDPGASGLDLDADGSIDLADTGIVGDTAVIAGGFDTDRDGVVGDTDSGLLAVPMIIGSGDADCVRGDGGADTARGGAADDLVVGDDGIDALEGGPGDDVVRGGSARDDVSGGDGDDELFGDDGPDTVDGELGDDSLYGGPGGDAMSGGPGRDELQGEGADDLLVGGTSGASAPDRDDTLHGGAGADVLFGDNTTTAGLVADLEPATPPSGEPDPGAVACTDPTSTALGCADLLVGGGGPDQLFGGLGDDELLGDGAQLDSAAAGDLLQGNSGDDEVRGEGGADVLVGGTTDDAVPDGAAGLADGDDDLFGGEAGDAAVGDNARVTFVDGGGPGSGATGTPILVVLDLPSHLDPPAFGAGGGDELHGGAGDDVLLGGLHDDLVVGGAGADVAEGNHGADQVHGDGDGVADAPRSGDDVLLGGTSDEAVGGDGPAPVSSDDEPAAGAPSASGLADGVDVVTGGPGGDLAIGDNGRRSGLVLDLPDAGASPPGDDEDPDGPLGGGDDIDGGAGADVLLGGLGDDTIDGDGDVAEPGADIIEGNHGADTIEAHGGDDVVLGGTSDDAAADGDAVGLADDADDIEAGAGEDVVVGDNGTRTGVPHDLPLGGAATVAGTGGGDLISGGPDDDGIRAGVGDDRVTGDGGEDRIEGNTDADEVHGGGDDDVVIGGTSAADHTDTGDVLLGDDGEDVVLGDNGRFEDGLAELLDVVVAPASDDADDGVSGDDDLSGGAGDDRLHGQGGRDVIAGGDGDDRIEGNHGGDVIAGGPGQDDVTGGGSAVDGVLDDDRSGDGLLDGSDTVHGDGPADLSEGTVEEFVASWPTAASAADAADVVGGDNAWIVRDGALRPGDGGASRAVTLFDVEVVGGVVGGGTSAGDALHGGGGNDHLYGQGGDEAPVVGGDGDDVVEGGHGSDRIVGGDGDDDLVGGSSARDGVLDDDRDPSGLLDGRDVVVGDGAVDGTSVPATDGDDTAAGDNAWIRRVLDAEGTGWSELEVTAPEARSILRRTVVQGDTAPGETDGSDVLVGNGGADDLYGQFDDGADAPLTGATCEGRALPAVEGDVVCAGDGDDGLLGDQGTMTPTLADELGAERVVSTAGGFAEERVFEAGTMVRVVELTQHDVGGADVLLGGRGRDAIHAGAGADLADGGDGEDVLFGHDGGDALWGGDDADRLYGGFGDDFLDVKPRRDIAGVTDPEAWFLVAPAVDTDGLQATTNGTDLHYGGEDADAMQADVAANGPVPGDRLLDWFGAYNINYVCASTNGAAVYSRGPAPATLEFMQVVATADGLVDVAVEGTAGDRSLALVSDGNKNPPHPDTPGHFTCEGPA